MKLRLSYQEAIRYKLVEDYMPYAEEPENNLRGFEVEAGLATFCDANDWYNVFWGYDTLGARCELVTIFISPELF